MKCYKHSLSKAINTLGEAPQTNPWRRTLTNISLEKYYKHLEKSYKHSLVKKRHKETLGDKNLEIKTLGDISLEKCFKLPGRRKLCRTKTIFGEVV